MSQHPPHLPNPSCNIRNHYRWLDIRLTLFVAVLGLIAGVAGASITLGWIWPGYGGGDTWVVSQNKNLQNGRFLEDIVYKESAERLFVVYKKESQLNGLSYLSLEDKIGAAVTVSSDGWLALYLPKNISVASAVSWLALSKDGAIFKTEKYVFDSAARIIYLKITPQGNSDGAVTQFKVAGFEETTNQLDDVFVGDGAHWSHTAIGRTKNLTPSVNRLDSAVSHVYALDKEFPASSMVINSRGRVLGFVNDEGDLLPVRALTRIMPGVLSKQVVEYPSFGVTGWLTSAQPALADEKISGFVVAGFINRKSGLRLGDVITEINGQIVNDESLWYTIGSGEASLTVYRTGKFIDLAAAAEKISPN